MVLVWSSKNIIIQNNVHPQKRWKPLEVQRCTKFFFFIDKCYVDAFPSIKCNEFSNLNTSFKIPHGYSEAVN